MSFILDALKKSENERQRQVGPSLADVQVSRRPNEKPWWVVVVAGLLVLNLAVLLIVLTRDGDEKPSGRAAANAATIDPANASRDVGTQMPLPASASRMPRGNPASNGVAPNPAVRALADEAGGVNADAAAGPSVGPAAAAVVPEGPPVVRPIEAPSVAPAATRPVFEAQAQSSGGSNEVLPTVNDIGASGTKLPDMHLDIHVYSANPAERFVFVNMRKYTEGQTLNEGPVLERITADGAVLNQHGLRFLLPRQ